MDENERDERLQQNACPNCGGTDFRWGGVGVGNAYGPIFHENDKEPGFFSQPRRTKLVARECSHCGNVQWFTRE